MKSKSSTKPIYNQQVEGAANNITSAYNTAKPGLEAGAAQFGGIVGSSIDRFTNGDPAIDAAKGYNTDVLNGKYLDEENPYLQSIIDRTNNTVRNQTQASYGSRGLTNGSDYALAIADRLAGNETSLRYQNYGAERDRMGQAVGQTPGLIAAENALLDPALAAYEAQQAPLRAAVGAGSGVGGLLGQYTKTTQKGSLAGLLAQMAGNAAQAYAGGGG